MASPILKSLKLGTSASNVRKNCILEGELVVYSDLVGKVGSRTSHAYAHDQQEGKILPFHRIRNHVARRGRFMNTEDDTP